MNCTPALAALVLGGVFETFPRLKVAFSNATMVRPDTSAALPGRGANRSIDPGIRS